MQDFLEEIKSPGGYEYYRVGIDGLPKNSFIVRNQAFRSVLYNPQSAGFVLQNRMKSAGEAFAQAIADLGLHGRAHRAELCELVFLSGGLFYSLNRGFMQNYGFSLPQCFVGISRQKVAGTVGEFRAKANYANFESLQKNNTIIVGDTIATGSTLVEGLDLLASELESKNLGIDRLVFCTLAGPLKGGFALQKAHERLCKINPHLETTFIMAEQAFHLMPDGTDLRFSGEDALAPELSADYTNEHYGQWLSENMKCAVFDWGTRCKSPMKHYAEFSEVAKKLLLDAPDEKSKEVLNRMLKQVGEERALYSGKI